ncbi:MAG TPA: hypothetical protein VFC47_08320 [Caulobacteraceae bacterium]|nr:hypothetical protein [Caulobacteraceae bacterium]
MTRWFTAAQLTTLALFVAAVLATFAYEMIWVWPARRCEARGDWWDARGLECDTPIPIARLTARGLRFGPASADVQDQRVAPGAHSTSSRP